jgi:hypothetical protein
MVSVISTRRIFVGCPVVLAEKKRRKKKKIRGV